MDRAVDLAAAAGDLKLQQFEFLGALAYETAETLSRHLVDELKEYHEDAKVSDPVWKFAYDSWNTMKESWGAYKEAYRLANNPEELLEALNGSGDRAVLSIGFGGEILVAPFLGIGQHGRGITVQQTGEGTEDDPAVYEMTMDARLLAILRSGTKKLPPPFDRLAYAQGLGSTSETLVFQFDTKEKAAEALRILAGPSQTHNLVEGALWPLYSGLLGQSEQRGFEDALDESLLWLAILRAAWKAERDGEAPNWQEVVKQAPNFNPGWRDELQDALASGETPELESDYTPVSQADFAFLEEHLHGTVRSFGFSMAAALDTTRVKKLLGSLGGDLRFYENIAVSRSVTPPEDTPGQVAQLPGQVSYTFTYSDDVSSRAMVNAPVKGISQFNFDYARYGDAGRSLTVTWELPPESFDGPQLLDDPLLAHLDEEREPPSPKWATVLSTARHDIDPIASLVSTKRGDHEFDVLRVTVENPMGRDDVLVERLLFAPDLRSALDELESGQPEGVHAMLSKGRVAASGVETQNGLGVYAGFGLGGYLYANVGVDDVVATDHEVLMGEGIPFDRHDSPRLLDTQPGRRMSPMLLQQGYDYVEVREGDTMSDIARRENVDLDEIIGLNGDHIPDPDDIRPGDVVFLPRKAYISSPRD